MKKVLFLSAILLCALTLGGVVLAQTAPLSAEIISPTAGASYDVGQNVPMAGNGHDGVAPYVFDWNFGDGSTASGQSYDKTYSQAGNFDITLLVTDAAGNQASIVRTVTINDVTPPAAPTVNFTVNGGAGPVTITSGQSATLAWTTSDATSCTASGAWSGGKATSGSEAVSPTSTSTYTLTCTGPGGDTAKSVTVNVSTPNPNNASVDLQASASTVTTGGSVTLSWTSSNVSSCTASGAWSGSKATSGSESTGALNTVGSYTYTLTCTGSNGSASDSVTLTVQDNGGTTLVITNVRVTDITQTTAIVRWTTNLPADSRVIYDTVSHPTLGSAPNYGYANSTGTSDTNPKVTEHAVTLTGLSANTQYFFRVLSQS